MNKKLYVGNLSYDTNTKSLEAMFGEYGEVQSVKIIEDMHSGRSKGFGFIEMATVEEASSALESLNGIELDGRPIRVYEARERTGFQKRRSYDSSY